MSEGGISVEFNRPYYLEEGAMVPLSLGWDRYHAELEVRLVFVSQRGNEWNYSFQIESYGDTYDDWLQIIYDRVPPLPEQIKKDSGAFDDLKINTKKRMETPFFQKRQYPRILLDTEVEWVHGVTSSPVHITDFNYLYASLPIVGGPVSGTLRLIDGVEFRCSFESVGRNKNSLYRLYGIEKVIQNKEAYERLLNWLAEKNRIAMGREKEIFREQMEREKEQERERNRIFNEVDLV